MESVPCSIYHVTFVETTFCRSNLADRQGKYLQEIGGDIFFIGGRAHKPRVPRRSGYVIEIYVDRATRFEIYDSTAFTTPTPKVLG